LTYHIGYDIIYIGATMNRYNYLGLFLISIPFIAMAILSFIVGGPILTLAIFSGTATIFGLVVAGVHLMDL